MPDLPAPIVPVEQRSIDFYGDELIALRDEEGTVWVPVRQLCEALGLSWSGQHGRIVRDAVLSEATRFVRVTRTNSTGGRPDVQALPLKFVRFWLAGINARRVKPEIRDKLIAYQREVIEIIDRAFTRAAPFAPAEVGEAHMVAMRDLARQQAEIWDAIIAERRRLSSVQQLAEEHEGMIQDLGRNVDQLWREMAGIQDEVKRLQQTESGQMRLMLPPGEAKLTAQQKGTIQSLVEDLVAAADAKGIKLWQGKNNYQAAYRTLNRTFGVSSYEDISQAQYPRAVEWLRREIARVERDP